MSSPIDVTQQRRAIQDGSSSDSAVNQLIVQTDELRRSADNWNNLYLTFVAAAVLIGALTTYFQYKALNKSRSLADSEGKLGRLKENDKDIQIEQARREAGEANAKAQGFANEIAQANARAAEANRLAENEHLERVRLEEKVAWRSISESQQYKLVTMLRKFYGTIADCSFAAGDMEAFSFSADIATALRSAGWNVIPPSPNVLQMKAIPGLPTSSSPIERLETGVEIVSTASAGNVTAARTG